MFEASDVLSNALQNIDGIIAEMELKNSMQKYTKDEKKTRIKNLLEDLIELTKDADVFDIDNRKRLLNWLREINSIDHSIVLSSNQNSNEQTRTSNGHYGSVNTQLLESELSVLKDQIEAQQDKIKEFEVRNSELQAQLMITENSYQEILKQKFKVDDEKSSLINELSRIKTINDDKIRLLESEISFFKKTLLERETEIASLRLYLAKLVRASNHLITGNDQTHPLCKSSDSLSKKNIEMRVSDKPPIVPRNYFNTQPQFKDSNLTGSFTMPSSSSIGSASSKKAGNHHIGNQYYINNKSSTSVLDERCLSPINRLDLATSKEQLEHLQQQEFCKDNLSTENFATGTYGPTNTYGIEELNLRPHHLFNTSSLSSSQNQQQFNSFFSPHHQINFSQFANQSPNSTCSTPNRSAKSSSSTLQNSNLPKGTADDSKMYLSSSKNSNPDLSRLRRGFDLVSSKDKTKGGFKWLLDRMKNNKAPLSPNSLSFSRSSLRATIGPQLRRQKVDVNQEFERWNSTMLADWFSSIGLGTYSEFVMKSMVTGEQLFNANDIQLEKLLQMKNYFHRKKLQLAIRTVCKIADELTINASKLDYVSVAKWLDDIGLPQYKETFVENRIDGCVLHHLTVDDLLKLKINAQLHHSSIRTGIFVLRSNSFNQNVLKRRGSATSSNCAVAPIVQSNGCDFSSGHQPTSLNISSPDSSMPNYDPAEVCLWTSHRVMEWLRSIDLAEYVANLRGAGVHGGLIIYEDTFNSNVLATLLSIPLNKSLLRRHIATYFIQLVGFEVGQRKLVHPDKTGCGLILNKIKQPKKSHFRNSFRKKKAQEYTYEDYVCPMSTSFNSLVESSVLSITNHSNANSSNSRSLRANTSGASKFDSDSLDEKNRSASPQSNQHIATETNYDQSESRI